MFKMFKKFKSYLSILLSLLIIVCPYTSKAQISSNYIKFMDTVDSINIVLDSTEFNMIPKNFRKSSDSINTSNYKNLNLTGLSNLNISGSAQFSEFNLPLIMNQLDKSVPKTIIDLRQESHGFINGLPISWRNSKNNANIGLTRKEVLSKEFNELASIKLNTPIILYNNPNRTIIPAKVQSENELVNFKLLPYIRIPVTDGKIPTDDMVDYFVDIVKCTPENTWFHFHCKEGIGRTTTFMIMYDMMKNYKQVTADDIIKRQLALANFTEENIKSFYNPERIAFLQNFYKYCKEKGEDFSVKWSDWEKSSNFNDNSTPLPTFCEANYITQNYNIALLFK